MLTHPQLAVALGGADCEAWRPGLLHQPVNALSSLAFAVAGVWVAVRPGAGRADRVGGAVYAGALIANGVGSFLYHGPGWPGAALVHDAAIQAALAFIAVEDVALLRGWTSRRRLRVYALGLGVAWSALALVPTAGVAVTALTGTLAATAEVWAAVAAARHRDHEARPRLPRAPAVLALAIAGLAGAALLAGRTESSLCRPDSLLQGHALWHMLAAAALLGWDRSRRARRAAAGRPGAVRSPAPWDGPRSR
ncbi:MAG TPA: hypothetical protein VE465_28270 [Streptosporangiaceae bacterium]|nr:hypothetical protein [Streptosporangiaceae bacterium]